MEAIMNIEKIKQRKKELGLTYDDIVNLSGLSKRTVCNIFSNDGNPRLDTVQAIEKALGISPTEENNSLTSEEVELLTEFRELTDEMRKYFLEIIKTAPKRTAKKESKNAVSMG